MDEMIERTASENDMEKLSLWCERMLKYRLPRWAELPEIDLYMDQVIALMVKYLDAFSDDTNKAVTPSIINNYVKLGLIPSPVRKKYSRMHIAHLMMICILKQAMPIQAVVNILSRQTERFELEDVYDHFCDEQESSLHTVLQQTARLCRETGDEQMLEDFILSTAISANSAKAVTDKILSFKAIETKDVK